MWRKTRICVSPWCSWPDSTRSSSLAAAWRGIPPRRKVQGSQWEPPQWAPTLPPTSPGPIPPWHYLWCETFSNKINWDNKRWYLKIEHDFLFISFYNLVHATGFAMERKLIGLEQTSKTSKLCLYNSQATARISLKYTNVIDFINLKSCNKDISDK